MIISLGIESTAHTYSIGIVDENGNIYSNERIIYKSEKGGIHPREAAELHSKESINILRNSVWKAGFVFKKLNGKFYIVDALYEIKNKLEGSEEKFYNEPWNRKRYIIYNNSKIWIENNKIVSDNKELKNILNSYINNLNNFERKINLISYSAGPGLYPTLIQAYFSGKLFSKIFNSNLIGVNHLIAHAEIVKLYNKFTDPLILLVSGAIQCYWLFEGNKYRIGWGNFRCRCR